jgi:hypothetical protein
VKTTQIEFQKQKYRVVAELTTPKKQQKKENHRSTERADLLPKVWNREPCWEGGRERACDEWGFPPRHCARAIGGVMGIGEWWESE